MYLLVFSQIPGGDKAVLCCTTGDTETWKKSESRAASIKASGFDAKNKSHGEAFT